MIMRLVLVLVFLAAPAAAQTLSDTARMIPILSGEHADFTRLSLKIGSRNWQIGRTAQGYGLRLSPRGAIGTGQVFSTIGRARIGDVMQTQSGLDVVLNCDCHMRSFRHERDWLVLDIVDGPPAANSPYELPLPADGGALPVILLQDQPLLPALLRSPSLPDPAVEAFDAALRQQVIEAARTESVSPVLALAQPVAQNLPIPAIDEIVPSPPNPAINLHYDAFVEGDALRAALSATVCADDRDFAMRDWAGATFAEQMAAGQLALAQAINPQETALQVAQTYVAYGFGQEAKQVLISFQIPQDRAGLLPALADIVDGKSAASAFAAQEGCRGAVTFWRALGMDSLRHLAGEDISALLETFRALPRDLRRQLAPRVAALFASSGDAGMASDVMEIVTSSGSGPQTFSADPRDPEHVVATIEAALLQGQTVTEDDLRLLQSLRYERRGTDAEPALQAAEARVLSALGLHPQALAAAATLPAELRNHTLADVVEEFIATATSDSFLSTALTLPPDVQPHSMNNVAKRLIDEGFSDLALRFLAPPATGADMSERRYLRAEAAGHLGLLEMVEAELLGLTDPRAETLRAAAWGTTPEAPSYAWRRADMPALRASDDALLQQAANAIVGEPVALPPTPLASREALIAQAQEARALANALLSRFSARP